MKTPLFQGACTALVTPFCADGPDQHQMEKLLDFQAEGGTKAVLLAGTTGEHATLEEREFERMTAHAIRYTAGRMKTIVGIGGNDPKDCLKKAQFAASAGADGCLMTPPYYNKTTQEGLIRHFCYVADRADLPLILYNVPSRTAIGISAEVYLALSSHPMINGVKEASGDFSLIGRVAAACGNDLNIWSGNDDHTVAMMALGAKGVVSVASNIIPDVISRLCQLCLDERFFEAGRLYAEYAEFYRMLFIETNPIPVKTAMSILGLDTGRLRLPLIEMSPEHRAALLQSMKDTGIIS